LFREGKFSYSDPTLTINQNQFLLTNPSWIIIDKDSEHTYELTSTKANMNNSSEEFLITGPLFKTLLKDKIENSISSDEAKLKLNEKKLVMMKKVHLKLPQTNGTIHLYTELLNLDLKNNLAYTKYEVEVRSDYFELRGEGFELKENSKGEALITFKGADLKRNQENRYEKFGSADVILFREGSDTLILQGSAQLNLKSMSMTADQIEYNYKTKTILNSKNSTLVGKS